MKKRSILLGVLLLIVGYVAFLYADIYNNRYTRYIKTLLLMEDTAKIEFDEKDGGEQILSSTADQLDIDATTEVEIATGLVDLNGALDVSDSLLVGAGTQIWKIEANTTTDSLDIITANDTLRIGFHEIDK